MISVSPVCSLAAEIGGGGGGGRPSTLRVSQGEKTAETSKEGSSCWCRPKSVCCCGESGAGSCSPTSVLGLLTAAISSGRGGLSPPCLDFLDRSLSLSLSLILSLTLSLLLSLCLSLTLASVPQSLLLKSTLLLLLLLSFVSTAVPPAILELSSSAREVFRTLLAGCSFSLLSGQLSGPEMHCCDFGGSLEPGATAFRTCRRRSSQEDLRRSSHQGLWAGGV
mmetsp:Transcript_52619/g.112233  ORF Transcript_52619/g.112233 Transcript_52619/m.112233 type:complete len:222 (+) Transcript_52619:2213-2878(+)